MNLMPDSDGLRLTAMFGNYICDTSERRIYRSELRRSSVHRGAGELSIRA